MLRGTAITTKYLSPTNTLGGRIKAAAPGGVTVTLPYDHAVGILDNHRAAAEIAATKATYLGKVSPAAFAGDPHGDGYVFVFVND